MEEQASVINDQDIDWLTRYIRNASPTGNERTGQQIWLEYIRPYIDEHVVVNYGNVSAIINPGMGFKVVLQAHADEIAWYVKRIGDDSFIHLQQTGGTDPGIAPSQRVTIHTAKGAVSGVFGWPAIHTQDITQDAPKQSSIFICCGCESRQTAESLGVQGRYFITYEAGLEVMNGDHYVGRALDNRMGGFMIALVSLPLRYLHPTVETTHKSDMENGMQLIYHTLQKIGPHFNFKYL